MPEPARRERREPRKLPPKTLYTETFDSPYEFEPPAREVPSFFLNLTKNLGGKVRGKRQARFTPELQETFEFLGWDVAPEEFYAASQALLMYGLGLGTAIGGVFFAFIAPMLKLDMMTGLLGALFGLMIPLLAALYYQRYPQMAAERERLLSLAYVPEIVNYLVMSLRINPNLERGVEFAASHGRGKIAEELKELIWGVQMGRYLSIEEGLDQMAYRWGNYSDDFKHALMVIRSSALEADKERRNALLEKASEDVLEGSREKMDLYARGLHQPSVFLYYFGILLPLMLAIILPISAAFVKGVPLASAASIFVIYCVLIPAGIWLYGGTILSGRPPTYVAPDIPETFPGLPRRGNMRVAGIELSYTFAALAVFALVVGLGFFLDGARIAQIPAYDLEKTLPTIPSVTLPLFGTLYTYAIFGLVVGLSCGLSVYLYGKYGARKRVQDEIRYMEGEFRDAVYVLASRLGENRPMEMALQNAVEFLPKSKIANRVFRKVLENIALLGLTLEAAVFDKVYGAMRDLPSQTIRSGMRVMVDAVELGVNVAAKSLIQLSIQIRNARKIDESLRRLLSDVTTLLNTMATFVAPVVLGVVTALQTIIINSLSGLGAGDQMASTETVRVGGLSFAGLGSILDTSSIKSSAASPGEFVFVMGVYVIEVVILLTYFNAQVEDSNNKLHTMVSISKALPVASILFAAVAYFATSSLASFG